MFEIKTICKSYIPRRQVEILGCPPGGLDALDFRREHGLPEAPTNVVELPNKCIRSEAVCRAFPALLDKHGDLVLDLTAQRGRLQILDPQVLVRALPILSGSSPVDHEVLRVLITDYWLDRRGAILREEDAAKDDARRAKAEAELARLEGLSIAALCDEALYLHEGELCLSRNHSARDVLGGWPRRLDQGTGSINPCPMELRHRAEALIDVLRAEQGRHERERRAAQEKEEAARQTWAAEHGSMRLRRCLEEKIPCKAVFLDEWLAVERPGWRWSDRVPGYYDDPRNPPDSAFEMLDSARASVGEDTARAALVYWEDDERGEDGTEPWRGYVAVADTPHGEIVWGGPPVD